MKQIEIENRKISFRESKFIAIALCIYTVSLNPSYADGFLPSSAPLKTLKMPTTMSIPKSVTSINQRPKIDKKALENIQGKKLDLVIENKGRKDLYKEIDYYQDGFIVIPFTGLGYDGEGNELPSSSLNWSYKIEGKNWIDFGKGRAVKLSIHPGSTPHVLNDRYNIDIRLSAKNKWGRTGQENMTISVLSIPK